VAQKVFQRGFLSLIVTQFFGAANDNLLKGVLSFGVALGGYWAGELGEGGQGYVSLCLTVPFILLSGYAGQLADRISKQKVTVLVKVWELLIAAVAIVGFWTANLWVAITAMLLLAVQSAFFGPAKYGAIPELVEERDLSRANGMINMMTNIAIIVGTLAAGPVYGAFDPPAEGEAPGLLAVTPGEPLHWLPGFVILAIALLGLTASLFMPRLDARDPDLIFDWNPFGTYVATIREMLGRPLFWVAMAWSFFYMIGMIAILILPDYKDVLGVSATAASILLGVLGISIAIGSVAAGWISGDRIEPRLIPVGAAGMTVFFVLLGLMPLEYFVVGGLLFAAGVFAGFYIIPLQALLQFLSPTGERGRFLGTANAISFVFSTAGSLMFILARQTLAIPPNRVFLICAGLAIVGGLLLLWPMRRLIADPELRKRTAETEDA